MLVAQLVSRDIAFMKHASITVATSLVKVKRSASEQRQATVTVYPTKGERGLTFEPAARRQLFQDLCFPLLPLRVMVHIHSHHVT